MGEIRAKLSEVFQLSPPRGRRLRRHAHRDADRAISTLASAWEATRFGEARNAADKFQLSPPRGRRLQNTTKIAAHFAAIWQINGGFYSYSPFISSLARQKCRKKFKSLRRSPRLLRIAVVGAIKISGQTRLEQAASFPWFRSCFHRKCPNGKYVQNQRPCQ